MAEPSIQGPYDSDAVLTYVIHINFQVAKVLGENLLGGFKSSESYKQVTALNVRHSGWKVN